eukprot:TRINITY_DN3519_c0_g1_i2.p1 TRINITY_DN3519_c0_g1~~TRINITY_DN3519_c0_g1_i2.p1  ORF type:complete len:880 (-),score=154.24 TRINITY_DN3519_c0_g1_i2:499-2925(-)
MPTTRSRSESMSNITPPTVSLGGVQLKLRTRSASFNVAAPPPGLSRKSSTEVGVKHAPSTEPSRKNSESSIVLPVAQTAASTPPEEEFEFPTLQRARSISTPLPPKRAASMPVSARGTSPMPFEHSALPLMRQRSRSPVHPEPRTRRFSGKLFAVAQAAAPGCFPATCFGKPTPKCFPQPDSSFQTSVIKFWGLLRLRSHELCTSRPFKVLISMLVLLNVIVLSLNWYKAPVAVDRFVSIANATLAALFGAEMIIQLLGRGIWNYVHNPFRVLDGVVTISALAELMAGHANGVSTALRVLRILRALRLIRIWPGMSSTLPTITAALKQSIYFLVLLFLLLFLFSTLGMSLYAGKIDPNSLAGTAGASFDTFWPAFLATFQVMTISNWPNLMYDVILGTGNSWQALFFVTTVLMTNYIMLNLFVGLLLDKFSEQSALDQQLRLAEFMRAALAEQLYSTKHRVKTNDSEVVRILTSHHSSKSLLEKKKPIMQRRRSSVAAMPKSLFLFSVLHPVRRFCSAVIASRIYNTFILVILLANAVSLALYSPFNDARTTVALVALNIIFCVVFVIEFVIAVIAKGFILHEGAYLRSGWNWLDFVALVCTIVDNCLPWYNLAPIRATRCLRPLRLVSKVRTMRVAALSLLRSLHAMFGLLCVLGVIWLVFAVIGVELFQGTFYQCSDPAISTELTCVGTSSDGDPLRWVSVMFPNFDNVALALLTLFQISTLQGWEGIMYQAIAATSPGNAPVPGHNPAVGLFFIVFVICGVVFMLNLFVGITVESFHQERARVYGTALFTEAQRHWWCTYRLSGR